MRTDFFLNSDKQSNKQPIKMLFNTSFAKRESEIKGVTIAVFVSALGGISGAIGAQRYGEGDPSPRKGTRVSVRGGGNNTCLSCE